jgi:secernin
MLFAKNSDRHPDEVQVFEWHDRRAASVALHMQYLSVPDADACAFAGSRPSWLWGVEHGVNEHRVAIGNEKVWTVDRPRELPPALLGMDLVRLALERARTADDAFDVITTFVERYGQGGSGEPHRDEPYFSSFLVVDPTGGWVIETSNRTWAARPAHDGDAISNRISLSTDWTRASPDIAPGADFDAFRRADMPTIIADCRLAVTRAATEPRAPTPAHIARTLRDHGTPDGALPGPADLEGHGISVCMHRRDAGAQTTASIIATLPAGDAPVRIWTALGNPCVSIYVPGFPPAIAPELADGGQWRRFARLRDRVEAAPAELAAVRAELGPVETELWDDAEAAAARGERGPLAGFAKSAWRLVDAALLRLGV